MATVGQFNPVYFQSTPQAGSIYNYTIFGERHSGTNWLEKIIYCRLNLPLVNNWGNNTSKHFIRYLDWSKLTNAHNTLFICITRNIYDWIGGFYKLPHHVDANICGSRHQFITSTWLSGDQDYNFITNKPYHDIFDMRKSKFIFYYEYLSMLVDNLLILKYEDLLINPENTITFISDQYHLKTTTKNYSSFILPRKKIPYRFASNIKEIINSRTDWRIENIYGYYPK